MVGSELTGLAKARWESQLIKTNRALADYAGQLAQDDLLPTRLPDKIQKAKWLKPKKSHDKVSKRSMTGAEAAEQTADKAERAVKRPTVSRPVEENDDEVVVPRTPPRTAPIVEESQGGGTIFVRPLAIRTPERLRPPPGVTPAQESSPETSPEPTELPASTAPARMEQERSRRSRKPNTLYTDSQYEMTKR
jgi:hypothetical protein